MQWSDKGYLLSKINYSENSIIIDVFTLSHGKFSGIVYGGSSKKNKKYLQVGNKILVNFKSKNENKTGYFTTELIEPISPYFFDNKEKILCILSASSILKILLPERQIHNNLFLSFEDLINKLFTEEWILTFIYWEQFLLKELGFDFNLSKFKINKETKPTNIPINGVIQKIPDIFFLQNQKEISNKLIREALLFNKKLFNENFFDGNVHKIPKSRSFFENCYF